MKYPNKRTIVWSVFKISDHLNKFWEFILAITYIIVVFSIIVQGLSIGKLVRWSQQPAKA